MAIENAIDRLRSGFSHEQLAKFLILMEQFKTKEQFSVFNLWNIKKTNKNEIVNKSISFSQGIPQKESRPRKKKGSSREESSSNANEESISFMELVKSTQSPQI
mmetsp:Transcript_2654/g.4123  ORF Transcript_2654/g.4123 Transcript_2654/m.4123 type:complete len:104 (-) Transcript_2654:749-1060(-)